MEDRLKEKLNKPLVLVVDAQNVYMPGQAWACDGFHRAIKQIQTILNRYSEDDVIFTRYIASDNPQGVWKDYNSENAEINSDKWLNDLSDNVKEFEHRDECYDKSTYSAYSIEEVRKRATEASCVVVTGVVAECCVLSTVMSLIDAGVYVIYLKDAVAGINEETEKATITILEGLAPLHLSIIDTEQYLSLRGCAGR